MGLGILEDSHDLGAAVGDAMTDTQCKECCADCPAVGATCKHEGITLETLPLEKNWWRATEVATVLYACKLTKACRGVSTIAYDVGNVSLCHTGHKGAAQPESHEPRALLRKERERERGCARAHGRGTHVW